MNVDGLTREEVAGRILQLPPHQQAEAATLALEVFGPAPTEHERIPLREYMGLAWPHVERRPFVDSWHIGVMAEHLEAVTDGEIQNLIINIPPRHTKSLTVSVLWPSWEWTHMPWLQYIYTSYAARLAKRDSLRMRRLITSPWYREQWGHVYALTSDQREKMRYENDQLGYRIATSVGGYATGEGGDRVVVDDPHKAGNVHSDARRNEVLDWWDEEMSSRVNDPKTSARVIIMQRLHEQDLTGHVLEQGGYVHLRIPARYEPRPYVYGAEVPDPPDDPVEWADPRDEAGEPLHPERFGDEELAELELRLGSYMTASQLQQRPTPESGGIVKRQWFRFWKPQHGDLPPVTIPLPEGESMQAPVKALPVKFNRLLQSWDMAFKAKTDSSYVVGQVWAAKGADRFLLAQERAHAEFTESLAMVRRMSRSWPQAEEKLVEDKANGPAIIDTLRSELGGIIAVEPEGDKMARLRAVTPIMEGGNVYLPHPAIAPWVWDYIEELAGQPKAAHDDQADATSQALRRMSSASLSVSAEDFPTVRR